MTPETEAELTYVLRQANRWVIAAYVFTAGAILALIAGVVFLLYQLNPIGFLLAVIALVISMICLRQVDNCQLHSGAWLLRYDITKRQALEQGGRNGPDQPDPA